MTVRIPLLWATLLGLCIVGLVACAVAWFILLSGICSNPRAAEPQTLHVISYSCHGMTVFITPGDDAMLRWLGPAGILLGFLAFLAATKVAQSIAGSLQDTGHAGRVRIVAVPPGEAPQWVRQKWVGLELPLEQPSAASITGLTAGVLSGPRTLFASLGFLASGQYRKRRGYKVNVLEAIAVLEKASPEAAAWWRSNTPHLMNPSRSFLFPEDVCSLVP